MAIERTFVMVKPDGVKRGLVGEIISIFEKSGLTTISLKLVRPTAEMVLKHYPDSDNWYTAVGNKTRESYDELGLDLLKSMGTEDPIEIGKIVRNWLVDYLTSGDAIAMVLEGNAAVKNVRRLCGNTLPVNADPGSIRGRFSLDSADLANMEMRAVRNLVHASGEVDEAEFEIGLWFPELNN